MLLNDLLLLQARSQWDVEFAVWRRKRWKSNIARTGDEVYRMETRYFVFPSVTFPSI